MKMLLNILTALLTFMTAAPEVFCEDSDASWSRLSESLNGKRTDISWTVSLKTARQSAKSGSIREYSSSGTLSAQDRCFRIESDAFRIYNDGNSLCTVNMADKEVTVEDALDAVSLLSDPSELLSLFGIRKKIVSSAVNFVGGKPVGIDLSLSDGSSLKLVFDTFHQSAPSGTDDYHLNVGRMDSSFTVTDLR